MRRTIVTATAPCQVAYSTPDGIVTDHIDISVEGANTKEKFMKQVKKDYPDHLISIEGEVKFFANVYEMDNEAFVAAAKFVGSDEVPEGFGSRNKEVK